MFYFWRTVYIAKTKSWNNQPSVTNFTSRKGKAEKPRLCAAKAHDIANLGMHIVLRRNLEASVILVVFDVLRCEWQASCQNTTLNRGILNVMAALPVTNSTLDRGILGEKDIVQAYSIVYLQQSLLKFVQLNTILLSTRRPRRRRVRDEVISVQGIAGISYGLDNLPIVLDRAKSLQTYLPETCCRCLPRISFMSLRIRKAALHMLEHLILFLLYLILRQHFKFICQI